MNNGIALFGYGYWGQNLMRNIYQSKFWDRILLVEIDKEKQLDCEKIYPDVVVDESSQSIFDNDEVKFIVIATPPHTHYDICLNALKNNKHVLIEKPFTNSYSKALHLHNLALEKDLTLMVDYTFLYTGAIEKINEIIGKKDLGKLLYIDSTRVNLGIFQTDVNVLWDLACHDLSIINQLVDKKLISVQASAISHSKNGYENLAYLILKYEDDFIVHINCSWTSPVKIRHMLIGGDKKMIVYNDIEPTDKVKVYDFSTNIESEKKKNEILVDYRLGDVYAPKIDNTEALKKVIKDFYNSVMNKTTPRSDSFSALKTLKILELAQKSISLNRTVNFTEE